MGPNRVNLYQPSTPSLLPRKLGERNGKIGKGESYRGEVGIRRLIPALFWGQVFVFFGNEFLK
jgi:hypothetical protein